MATSSTNSRLLVAAIDFGTTFSGVAFSLYDDFKRDPLQIQLKSWLSSNLISHKAPTCVLIEEDGSKARAFGYEAESEYASDPERESLYLFKRFKMLLDVESGLNKEVVVEDVQGRQLPAFQVFSLSIRYLKEQLIMMLNSQAGLTNGLLKSTEIYWVLTVPAIWNDSAKQFMREAALQAGIADSQLMLALEPEVASIYCRYLSLTKLGQDDGDLDTFQEGSQYMVLDAGGGTVDITVHELVDQSVVKEVEVASGGPWGGVTVDQAYYDFLERIIGPGILAELRKASYEDEMFIVQMFEILKRKVSPDQTEPTQLRLPLLALNEAASALFGEDVHAIIKKSPYKDNLRLKRDLMIIDAEVCKEFFKSAIDQIIGHTNAILSKPNTVNCKHIIMVGGFSESPMLQEAIKKAFPEHKVIVPAEAGLAVLKGAVMFGHDPAVISQRICRYTYGTDIVRPFVPRKHPESKRDPFSSFYCRDCFLPFVKVGDHLKIGQPSTQIVLSPSISSKYSKQMKVRLYAAKGAEPTFVTDDGCVKIGEVVVPMPESVTRKTVEVRLILGGTEIQVECKYMHTGEVTRLIVDFLG